MEIELTLEQRGRSQLLTFGYTRMVNAGYVGRDQDEVRRHIDELAKKGIPGPKTTPALYPVIARNLVTDAEIEVYGQKTCGEVEYVLLIEDEHTIYVGLGSDHSDRHLEETDIPRCKQICPNVLSKTVWPLAEVEDHWDDLEIQSKVIKDGQEVLYQKGPLELILDPKALMKFVWSKVPGLLNETIIFSGTLGTLTGGFVYGERFTAQLVDSKLDRRLELAYDIRPLDYMTVE
ncbi:MAG: DUF2848 family protein [Deltaproteobacteria bacterium]|nr:MAG: DUF2848 family protein [Deltaproteobacteria bacterium]